MKPLLPTLKLNLVCFNALLNKVAIKFAAGHVICCTVLQRMRYGRGVFLLFPSVLIPNSGEIISCFPGVFDFKMEILMLTSQWSNLTWLNTI